MGLLVFSLSQVLATTSSYIRIESLVDIILAASTVQCGVTNFVNVLVVESRAQ